MKTFGATELAVLRGFVRDVLRTCELDTEGITTDLYDPAMQAAEILGIVAVPFVDEEDEDEDDGDYHRHTYED